MEQHIVQANIQEQLKGIYATVIEVISNPKGFFSKMPKTGGFVQPLLFMVVLGVVSGLITSVLSLVGVGPAGAMLSGLASVILIPIVVAIFGFVGAGILFIIWKVLGSQESFETAYRGMAYTAAIMPITTILNFVPYVGGVIGLVWLTYLLVVVSTEVHAIKQQTAWIIFGFFFAVIALISISAETGERKVTREMGKQTQQDKVKETGEPSEKDLTEAMKVLFRAELPKNDMLTNQFLAGLQVVKNGECIKIDSHAFDCNFSYVFLGEDQTGQMVFTNVTGRWEVSLNPSHYEQSQLSEPMELFE